MPIILASQSPRRRELLSVVTRDFVVDPSHKKEDIIPGLTERQLPLHLARQKALDVSCRHTDDLVIGADTVVCVNGQVLGKPLDKQDAYHMLRLLSGQEHRVLTGVVFCRGQSVQTSFVQNTRVVFYPLDEKEILDYLETDEPYDKAGAYAIQGKGSLFVKAIYGDYYNVMGFPVARIARELNRLRENGSL